MKMEIKRSETPSGKTPKKDNTQKSIMILGAGFDQFPMLETAKSMGLRVIAVDADKNAPGFYISDLNYTADVMDSKKILDIARENNIGGITTMVSNLGMRTVAFVAEKMGLVSISQKAAQKATDKKYIKEYLMEAGVAVPAGIYATSVNEALESIDQISFPVIVKPADGTKGRGISVAVSEKDLKESVILAMEFSTSKSIIVEEWVEGPTIGAECLIIEGELEPVLLTDKYNTPPPQCVTIGLTAPSGFPRTVKNKVRNTAKEVAKVLGLNTGAAHIDMIVGKDGIPRVIDVGPRLASGPVTFDFIPNLFGIDMVRAVIDMAMGEKTELNMKWNGKFAASRFLTAARKGCMYRIEVPRYHKNFIFYQYKEIGELVGPPNSDTDRIGCITIKDYSYDKTLKSADELLEKIKVTVVY
jgi:biotin carboxylase